VADKAFCIVLRATTLLFCIRYLIFAMSSDNASSTVTYTSVSSNSNGPSSWGIPLVNADEIPDMDPYEENTQSTMHHQMMAFISRISLMLMMLHLLRRTDDEDPEEDDNEDPEEDPSEEHEPEDKDAKENEPSEDSDETGPFEENKTAATPPPPRSPQTRIPFFADMSL
ncbi:hypothetical protein Tco_0479068, partial [Tanacetum coccineum]